MLSSASIAFVLIGAQGTSTSTLSTEQIFLDLSHEDPAVIARGATRAGASHRSVFVDPLRTLAASPYPLVRHAATAALGDLGVPRWSGDLSALLATLIQATQDAEPSVAASAVRALARHPYPEAIARLTAIAEAPANPSLAAIAKEALTTIDPAEVEGRLSAYLQVSRAEVDRRRRGLPLTPELRFGDTSPLALVARDLLSSGDRLHLDAVARLEAHPDHAAARPFLARALLEPGAVRARAALALARQKDPAATRALLGLFDDQDVEVRNAAILAAGATPSPQAASALVARLAIETNRQLLPRIAAALVPQADQDVLRAWLNWPPKVSEASMKLALDRTELSKAPETAVALVRFLARELDPGTSARIERALLARSQHATAALLQFLSQTGLGSRGRAEVVRLLEADKDPKILSVALAVIAEGRGDANVARLVRARLDSESEPILLGLLGSPDPRVRGPALSAAADLRGPGVAVAALSALERDPDDGGAFELLINQTPEERLSPLLEVLERPGLSNHHAVAMASLRGTQDPRIVAPVVAAARARPELARAAIDLLEAEGSAPARAGLGRLAADEAIVPADRAMAIDAIAKAEAGDRVDLLLPLAGDDELLVKMSARNALHRLEPTVYPEWDPYGRIPLIAESGVLGATMLLMANEIAGANLSPAFTSGVGLLLGGATPFLLTLEEDITLGEAAYFGTYGAWGTVGGYGLGGRLFEDRQRRLFTALGGEAVGVAIGALSMQLTEWGPSDALLANATALEAALITGSLARMIAKNDEDRVEASLHYAFLGGALASLPMTVLARRVDLEGRGPLLGTTMAHGALLGGIAPALMPDGATAEQVAAGLVAGQGVGYLVGLTWAQLGDPSAGSMIASGLGAGLGIATMGGLGLLVDADRRGQAGLVEAGALGGALALGILGPRLELSGNDAAIVSLLALGGAMAGSDLSVRIAEDNLDGRAIAGGALFGAGVGTAVGLAATQVLELSNRTLWSSVGAGLVLGAGGSGFGYLFEDLSARNRNRITSGAFLTGLALTLPFAESLDYSPGALAFASLTATTFGLSGAFLPAYSTPEGAGLDGAKVGGGLVFGTALGFSAGFAVAQALELDVSQVGVLGAATFAGAAMGSGLGLVSPGIDRGPTAALFHGGALLGLAGSTLVMELEALDGGGDRSFAAATHSLVFVGHGLLQGSLIPLARSPGPIQSQEVAGGMLLGAGTGALLGMVLSRTLDAPIEPPDLVEASLHTTLLLGASLGVGLFTEDRQIGAGLAEGLGLGGYALAYALAPHTNYDDAAGATMSMGAATFGAMGGFFPYVLDVEPSGLSHAGGTVLGTSLGILAASVYTQVDADREEPLLMAATIAGGGLGAGLGLLLPEDRRRTVGLAEAGAALGLGLSLGLSSLAPEYEAGDYALLGLLATHGAWLGSHVGALVDRDGTNERAGGGTFGASLGLATALVVGPFYDPDPVDVLETGLLATFASATGAGVALALPDGSRRAGALAIEAAGASGLVLSALVAHRTDYSLDDLVFAGLTGTAFGYAGSFAPLVFGESTDRQRAGGAMAGASFGTLAGLALSELHPMGLETQLESGAAGFFGGALGHGLGLLFPELSTRSKGILGGGLALSTFGLATALAPYTQYSDGDRILIPLGGALGTLVGLSSPILLGKDPTTVSQDERVGGILTGGSAGLLVFAGLSQLIDPEPDEVVEAALYAGIGHGLGFGLGVLLPDTPLRGELALMSGVGALGLGVGIALAPSTDLDRTSPMTLGLATTIGATFGAATPLYWSGDDLTAMPKDRLGGGALLGASLGLASGLLLDQTLALGPELQTEAALGAGLGALSGAGLGLALSTDDRLAAGLFQGLTLAGSISLAAIGPGPELDLGDVAFGSAYVAYLTWHAAGLSLLTGGTDRQAVGLTMSTIGLGALTGRYLAPYVHLGPEDVLMLLAGNVWGTWIGGWGGVVLQDKLIELDDGRQGAGLTLLSSAAGSDVGLLVSGMVVSGLLDVEPTRFAAINLAGITGMISGMFIASAAESEPLKAGNVIGSLSGLVLGAVVTSFFDFSATPTWDDLLDRKKETITLVAPPSAPTGMPEIEAWFPSATVEATPEGDPRYVFSLQGIW